MFDGGIVGRWRKMLNGDAMRETHKSWLSIHCSTAPKREENNWYAGIIKVKWKILINDHDTLSHWHNKCSLRWNHKWPHLTILIFQKCIIFITKTRFLSVNWSMVKRIVVWFISSHYMRQREAFNFYSMKSGFWFFFRN